MALIDSGINPYHVTFRDSSSRAFRPPWTYVPGYPRDAKPLRISLDEPDYAAAVKKDCRRVWSKVEPGTLYWFPGTKIIGAVTERVSRPNCESTMPAGIGILDYHGHGTMVASRAASTEYGACAACLVVAVQGTSKESLEWTASNSDWIDAQSNSWGPFLPLWQPDGTNGYTWNDPTFVRAVESAARKQLALWASGNGTLTRLGVIGHPTLIDPRMTPSVVMVGGHDSGHVNLWPDFPPHVVSDSCNSWAAANDSTDRSAEDLGGGTSAAAPFAAGAAVSLALEARRILGDGGSGVRDGIVAEGPAGVVEQGPLSDGKLTLHEWKDLLLKTATPRPAGQREDGSVCGAESALYASTPLRWEDVPESYPEFLHIGYGATDEQARKLATGVLGGATPMPDRSRTDAYFEADAVVRQAAHDVYGGS